MTIPDRFALKRIQWVQKATAILACSLGAVALIGWCAGLQQLHTPLPGNGTMQPPTAVALLLGGISLFLWQRPLTKHRIRGAKACASAVAATGLLSTIKHLAHRSFGEDTQVLFDGIWLRTVFPPEHQMALTTAVSFSFAGCALCLIDGRKHLRQRPEEWLVLALSLLPFMVLLGYFYGVDGFKAPLGPPVSSAKMALPTAIGLLVLACGILVARPEHGWMARFASNGPGGVIMRRLLPAAAVMLLGLGVTAETVRRSGLFGHRVGEVLVTALSIVIVGVLIDRCTRTLIALEKSRREAEEKLKKSEARLRMALEAARIGTWEWDIASDHVWWSESIYDLFRIPRGAFDGRFESFLRLVHPDDHETIQARVRRTLERVEDSYTVEFRAIMPDGTLRHMAGRGNVVFNSSRTVMALAGTMMDVTERKLLERELIEASNREQRRLGQDLHDDLGQWLTAIHLEARAVSMFLKSISEPGAARVEKLSSWMGEALERTRMLARGMTPAVIETGGLSAALEDLVISTEKMFRCRCRLICDNDLTIRNSEAALQLYRIAQEAISNALRHGQANEIDVMLEQPKDGYGRLLIRDNGKGISNPLPKNSGLGMRIMKYRAELLGADVEIRARKERGTEVICYFPKEL